jgi:hypothetical protein
MSSANRYVGIHEDVNGGLTATGKIIRDAWVFDIIPEGETCEGWLDDEIDALRQKANVQWKQYGFLVSNLPEALRERFMRIHAQAVSVTRGDGQYEYKQQSSNA